MKRLLVCSTALLALISCNNAGNAPAKTDSPATEAAKTETPAPPMDSAAMMKAWADFMTPGDNHAMMAKWDGNWKAEVTMWMAPDAPPQTSTATCTNKMIYGGRYQQSTHKGNFNGMPFEGMSLMGYDNAKKKFVSTWIDNMGTGIMSMDGEMNAATKTMEFKGSCTDPMTGKNMNVRETVSMPDSNTQVMEMFMPGPDGKEFKNMKIVFKRG